MRTTLRILAATLTAIVAVACQSAATQPMNEREALLQQVTELSPPTAQTILDAPFWSTPDLGADIPTLRSVIAILEADLTPPVSRQTTDAETWRIAPYHQFQARQSEAHARRLLNPYQWQLETRRIEGIEVGVLWARGIETQIPWPAIGNAITANRRIAGADLSPSESRALVIVYGAPLHRHSQAESRPTHISIRSGYAQDPDAAAWILAHEITHRWWQGNAPYVDEGIAELVAAISTGKPRPAKAATPCLSRTLDTRPERPPQLCDYQLGGELMDGLLRTAGPERFNAAMSKLFQQASPENPVTLRELKRAFPQRKSRAIIDALENPKP